MDEISGLENITFESAATYTFIEEIGRGGMGIVYLATRNCGGVGDYVVLKTIRTLNPDDEAKLKQEASLATLLRHENIVKTYGLEYIPLSLLPESFHRSLERLSFDRSIPSENAPFRRLRRGEYQGKQSLLRRAMQGEDQLLLMVMDYIDGIDLHDLITNHLREGYLIPVPLAAFIISRIARALAYAHQYLIHRDISPENILVNTQGVCKLTDFGIAVVANQQPDYWAGKLTFMAPEQLQNRPIDERADIYALGLVAYKMLTGSHLIYSSPGLSFEEQAEIIQIQMEEQPIPLNEFVSDIPKELSDIILKMLSVSPASRYQRASSVVYDLERKYLYAKGYGPTNNSLSSYISIFESGFEHYNEEQLDPLGFLKDEKGEIQLKRYLSQDLYTKKALKFIKKRQETYLCRRLVEIKKKSEDTKEKYEEAKDSKAKLPFLKVRYMENVLESFKLMEDEEYSIGRGEDNFIILPDQGVSRKHAKMKFESNAPIIEDQGSFNGTYINGEKAKNSSLKEGDKVQIGPFLLFFLREFELKQLQSDKILDADTEAPGSSILSSPDFMLRFSYKFDALTRISDIVSQILKKTNLGELKRDVIPMGVAEVLQLLIKGEAKLIELRVIQTQFKLTFICSTGDYTQGYNNFLNAIYQYIEQPSPEEEGNPMYLAMAVILKSFDRIELRRHTHQVILENRY